MKHPEYLRSAFLLAVALLLGLAAVWVGWESVGSVWSRGGSTNQIMLVIIIVCITFWLLSWLIFDAFESAQFASRVRKFMTPPQGLGAYALAVLIAASFAGMVVSIGNVPVFIALMAAVVLGTSFGDYFVIRNLNLDLKTYISAAGENLVAYYTNRWHMLLHCIQLFLLAIAACVYLFIVRTVEPGSEWVVYLILSISILFNESMLWNWRWSRFSSKEVAEK